MKKVIVFDLDGVLFDSLPIAKADFMYRYPDATDGQFEQIYLGNIHEELRKLTIPLRKETDEERNARTAAYSQKKLGAPMYSGVRDVIQSLHGKGYVLCVNTSAHSRNTLPLLEKHGILHMFDFIGTKDVSPSKLEKLLMIMNKYDVSKDDLVFITDTLGDLKESAIAGVPTIGVTWGVHERNHFNKNEYPNLAGIADSADELATLLE